MRDNNTGAPRVFKPEPEWLTLAAAFEYVGDRSIWRRRFTVYSPEWQRLLERDIKDKLAIGEIEATGRRPMSVARDSLYAREIIDPTDWTISKTDFIGILEGDEAKGGRLWVYPKGQGGAELKWQDIELRAAHVKKMWPPVPLKEFQKSGSVFRRQSEERREFAKGERALKLLRKTAEVERHHTMGGDVLRIGKPPKAKPSRTFVQWLRDFFMVW